MAERQLSGLAMHRQLYWAEKYKSRFPRCRIILGGINDDVEVHGLPSYPDPNERLVLEEMDSEIHEEWRVK